MGDREEKTTTKKILYRVTIYRDRMLLGGVAEGDMHLAAPPCSSNLAIWG